MLSRYRKIKEDSRLSAAEDKGHTASCSFSADSDGEKRDVVTRSKTV